jgi:hypothetical protein
LLGFPSCIYALAGESLADGAIPTGKVFADIMLDMERLYILSAYWNLCAGSVLAFGISRGAIT